MKHDCQETELLLSGYLNGELTQSDRQRVDLILEDCRQCKSYIFMILRNNLKKYNNNILIELGSYHGDTTKAAIGFGYKKVFTCELQPHLYEICKQNLKTEIANKLVDLRLSDSRDFLKDILPLIDEKATILLDAHIDEGNFHPSLTPLVDTYCPVLDELSLIHKYSKCDHTLIIDDYKLIKKGGWGSGITFDDVVDKIKVINPEYKIFIEDDNIVCLVDSNFTSATPPITDIGKYIYEKYLKNIQNGTYIECGAANGAFQSNTLLLDRTGNWKGILIEPNPHAYKELIKCRKNVFAANCALVSHDYKEEYIEGFFGANLWALSPKGVVTAGTPSQKEFEDMLSGQIKTNINYDKERFPDDKKLLEVPAKTLDAIFKDSSFTKADFFSLDVEGYEENVLRGWTPEKYPIEYLLIEAAGTEKNTQNIKTYMNKHDYNFLETIDPSSNLFFKKNPNQYLLDKKNNDH
jgi:FkbM family methyltransferase